MKTETGSKKGQVVETKKDQVNGDTGSATATMQVKTPVFKVTPFGLERLRDDFTIEDVTEIIEKCEHTEDHEAAEAREAAAGSEAFQVGDAVAAGAEKFGEGTLKEWAAAHHKNYGTLRNRKRISEAVPLSLRNDIVRHYEASNNGYKLKYNLFVKAAVLRTEDSKRSLLEKAINNKWSAQQLADEIKKFRPGSDKPKTVASKVVVNSIQRAAKQIKASWDKWDDAGRSEVSIELKKLGAHFTQDVGGNLVLVAPSTESAAAGPSSSVPEPVLEKASAADVAAAAFPSQVTVIMGTAPVAH